MSHEANHIYFTCFVPVRIVFLCGNICCSNHFNETLFAMVFSFSSLTQWTLPSWGWLMWINCTGSQLHCICDLIKYKMRWDTMPTATWHTPYSSRQEGIHNVGRPRCIWCIRGHSCTGSHFFGICASKSGSHWMNLSSCWPTTVWLQLLLCPYQLIVVYCNLFSCNGAVVLRVCWHVTLIMAITIIVIAKWHWRLDTFNGITMLIVALGVTLGICSCVTRMTQISGCTRLVLEILCTFWHQLYGEPAVTAAFLPQQG